MYIDKVDKIHAINFKYFLIKTLKIVDPKTKFLGNWHIDLLCDALEAVRKREILRLIINIAPRSLKSVITSVAFPAWILAKEPSERIIVSSYSNMLATKHSNDTRFVMQSDWYRKNFPESLILQNNNTKNKFLTINKGYRLATSINGALTGEGGNILIADDPNNPGKIYSKLERKKTANWFDNVFSSRLNDKYKGAIIIVMQRLHEEDLTGYLLNKGNDWHVITLPAIATKNEMISFNAKDYKFRKKGSVLHSSRENIEKVEEAKVNLGTNTFMAQYQQQPISAKGNLIKKEWIKYDEISNFLINNNVNESNFKKYISIDCANGVGIENDFTVIGLFYIDIVKDIIYLVEMLRVKLEYPYLRSEVVNIVDKHDPNYILIEDKSNGSSLIHDLKQIYKVENLSNIRIDKKNNDIDVSNDIKKIIAIKPLKSKETRVNDIVSFLESGNFIIAKDISWNMDLESEMLAFPFGKHDDQVDVISQLINWYIENMLNRKNEQDNILDNVPKFRFL